MQILNDIKNDKDFLDVNIYENIKHNFDSNEENKDYNYIINPKFNIFNKNELFSLALKNIYELYENTKINSEFSLQRYLEIYDNYTEANFPPFSLLEIKDYEYFYEDIDNDSDLENSKAISNEIQIIKEKYLEQFRNISITTF